jgi:hypothetical protein
MKSRMRERKSSGSFPRKKAKRGAGARGLLSLSALYAAHILSKINDLRHGTGRRNQLSRAVFSPGKRSYHVVVQTCRPLVEKHLQTSALELAARHLLAIRGPFPPFRSWPSVTKPGWGPFSFQLPRSQVR